MSFEMPVELPATTSELNALITAATKDINLLRARAEAEPDTITNADVDRLDELAANLKTLRTASAAAELDETAHADKLSAALENAAKATDPVEEADETPDADEVPDADEGADVVAEAEAAAKAAAEKEPVKVGAAAKKVNFVRGQKADVPSDNDEGPQWKVAHGAPGFKPEQIGTRVGFDAMGEALDREVSRHPMAQSASARRSGPKVRQALATITRDMEVHEDMHALVAAIERAGQFLPDGTPVTAEALTAAGGWCAPSEQIYTFCDVPNATDLISLPEIAIRRGGLRWPIEPDLAAIFNSYEWFFNETELEAVDGSGNPTAIKHSVEIPCPDEFGEMRLSAVGYSVIAGILQRQGWPESIEWFLRSLTQEHLRGMSRRTINDMVAGSGSVKVFDAALQVGGTSAVLNSLAMMATNLRLNKGLARNATIEGVAPSWLHEALRADLAMQQGKDTNAVSDAEITGWLSARNIYLQYVGDWQTRGLGLPGNMTTYRWPGHVDIMLYPAGTWFRHLSNVIEVGVIYPKEELQINRYTEFFTEDAVAVGKRCDQSVNVRIPLKVNGGYGGSVTITHTDTVSSNTLTVTATGGTYTLTYAGKVTTALAFGASAATIKAALVALDDGYGTTDFTVSGTGPFTIEGPGGALSVQPASLTGGTATVA